MYAYGVVLLELLTGRPAVDGSRPNGCQLLAQWLLPSLSSVTRLWVSLSSGLTVHPMHTAPCIRYIHAAAPQVPSHPSMTLYIPISWGRCR